MSEVQNALEYKCPCCDSGLVFSETAQKMICNACQTEFELDAVEDYHAYQSENSVESFQWDESNKNSFSQDEEEQLQEFSCPACGGQILSDANTAASFCPYCENPAILPTRLSGVWKPDAVLPFRTTKEDAKKALLALCKGKVLLPKEFTAENRLEKITGMYVPFWLYGCDSNFYGRYNATRIHRWSDSQYNYKRTDHYLLTRKSRASFNGIPMDGSSKMDNAIMESIEPFDYSKMVDFDMAYLSGFFAEKYDVEAELGKERVRQRVACSMDEMLQLTFMGYSSVIPTTRQLNVAHGKAKYVLLPVWMLHTKYRGKTYIFAMNGQSGKMTGTFPICPKRSWAWFGGITAGVALISALIQFLLM